MDVLNSDKLKLASWNCRGLKNKKEFISDLCRGLDLVALQETFLFPYETNEIENISQDFKGYSKSSIDPTVKIIKSRPYGGLTFLWRESLDEFISICNFESDRLLGLMLNINGCKILFINVYMPWYNRGNHLHFDHYVQLLGELQSIIHDSDADHFCIIGDFNAHPTRPFFNELSQFCQTNTLHISDFELLDDDSYTYLQHREGNIHTSWLDHCLTSQLLHESIDNFTIRYDLGITDDHFPIQVYFNVPSPPDQRNVLQRTPRINWNFSNTQKAAAFTTISEHKLRNVPQPATTLLCNNPNCHSDQHKRDLSTFYNNIIDALLSSGSTIFNYVRDNRRVIPGWNDYVKEFHQQARNSFLLWRENGSPRNGPLAFLMRRTRAHFKRALRLCRANEAQNRADALSANLMHNNHTQFWKSIKSLSPKSKSTTQRIGNAVGEEAISNYWADHFDSILNCIVDRESEHRVNELLSRDNPIEDRFSPEDVKVAIKKLSGNKSVGCDGLPAEAYKHAHPIIHELLAAIYNACLMHRFLPESLLLVHLIPLIKNKLKDHSDPGNYRPIAITTISSKILESLLLVKLEPYLHTTDNQFDFKAEHSTDSCIYLLKEIINFYTASGSPVFLCFVDVRKAFDRVNYNKLFLKLHERGTPLYVIGLLSFWFSTQKFCVSWGTTLSRTFG